MTSARDKLKKLWQMGDLFHNFSRYPRKSGVPKVDRLAGVLRSGIVAPASCDDGTVFSDLNLEVVGSSVPYDSLVFLHRFGPQSYIYTFSEPGRVAVFIAPDTPVLTPKEMGRNWAILCQDEVYVRDRIGVENLIGVVVHPADADAVINEFLADFERLAIPLYLYNGGVVWPRE